VDERRGAAWRAARRGLGRDRLRRPQAVPLERTLEAAAKRACGGGDLARGVRQRQRHDLAAIARSAVSAGFCSLWTRFSRWARVPVDVESDEDRLPRGWRAEVAAESGGNGPVLCRRSWWSARRAGAGSVSVINSMDFDHYDLTLRRDPAASNRRREHRRAAGDEASLGLFTRWRGGGVAADQGARGSIGGWRVARGYTVASPRDGEQWSGIVSFASSTHPAGGNASAPTRSPKRFARASHRNGRSARAREGFAAFLQYRCAD